MKNIYLKKKMIKMSKKVINNISTINNNFYTTGYTLSLTNPMLSNILSISNKNGVEVMKISPDGELYYRINDNMIKVEIPEDLVEAFSHVILNYTGKSPDDVMIERYVDKILKNEKSDEYISKLEKAFRKLKIKKINNQ